MTLLARFLAVLQLVAALACAAQTDETSALRIRLSSPLDYQVTQRQTRMNGTIIIAGVMLPESRQALPVNRLEARVLGKDLTGTWQALAFDPRVSAFRGEISVPAGGWYRVEVRALRRGEIAAKAEVEHVGVGEVFVIIGQSNSANYGQEKSTNVTGLVSAYDGAGWRLAGDPEPGAGGRGGSFMAPFGDEMAQRFNVPIGLVPMGIGSTSAREWLPQGVTFTNLPPLTRNVVTVGPSQWESSGVIFSNFVARLRGLRPHGFRAVLWHQGESDAHQGEAERTLPGEFYRQYLDKIITDMRSEIGWDAPWFVAQVSYHSPTDASSPDIRGAQKALWDEGLALQGPDTDTLTGEMRDHNGTGVHLSGKGLREHARLWVEKVGPWLDERLGGK